MYLLKFFYRSRGFSRGHLNPFIGPPGKWGITEAFYRTRGLVGDNWSPFIGPGVSGIHRLVLLPDNGRTELYTLDLTIYKWYNTRQQCKYFNNSIGIKSEEKVRSANSNGWDFIFELEKNLKKKYAPQIQMDGILYLNVGCWGFISTTIMAKPIKMPSMMRWNSESWMRWIQQKNIGKNISGCID